VASASHDSYAITSFDTSANLPGLLALQLLHCLSSFIDPLQDPPQPAAAPRSIQVATCVPKYWQQQHNVSMLCNITAAWARRLYTVQRAPAWQSMFQYRTTTSAHTALQACQTHS